MKRARDVRELSELPWAHREDDLELVASEQIDRPLLRDLREGKRLRVDALHVKLQVFVVPLMNGTTFTCEQSIGMNASKPTSRSSQTPHAKPCGNERSHPALVA